MQRACEKPHERHTSSSSSSPSSVVVDDIEDGLRETAAQSKSNSAESSWLSWATEENPDRKVSNRRSPAKGRGCTVPSRSKRSDSAPTDNNRTSILEFDESLYRLPHLSRWPFGMFKTIALVISCVAGLILTILARRSLAYVHLGTPMDFYPLYEPVYKVGLSRLHVCLNETAVVEADALDQEFLDACHVYELSLDIVNDTNWNVARACLGAATLLGASITAILMITVWYWQTMNLKPICMGLLVTYLLGSCGFFIYDSDLCRMNKCRAGEGTVYSIVASVFWFAASLLSIRMDVIMMRRKRRLKRKRNRALRRIERRKRRLKRRETSLTSESTKSASDDGSIDRARLFDR